jgi:hypothetical protein
MTEAGNTYQLEPLPDEVFYPSRARRIIEEVFNDKLKGAKYDLGNAQEITEELSKIIRSKIKDLKIPRYKVAVQVIYGELKGQGLRIASKSLWDPNFDNWTSYTFTSETIHCTGIVFGNYFE